MKLVASVIHELKTNIPLSSGLALILGLLVFWIVGSMATNAKDTVPLSALPSAIPAPIPISPAIRPIFNVSGMPAINVGSIWRPEISDPNGYFREG